jgi:hypothetical protein
MISGTIGGHRDRRLHPRRADVLAAALIVTVVLAASCGGGPAGPGHPPGYQRYHTYSQCMRSQGAPFWPEPSQVPQGVLDNPDTYKITTRILAEEHGPHWQAALTACQKVAPRQLPYTAAQVSALRSELQKLAACMRSHGITRFPSPAAGPYGAGFQSFGPGVDPGSARFRAAQRTCWVYAPGS